MKDNGFHSIFSLALATFTAVPASLTAVRAVSGRPLSVMRMSISAHWHTSKTPCLRYLAESPNSMDLFALLIICCFTCVPIMPGFANAVLRKARCREETAIDTDTAGAFDSQRTIEGVPIALKYSSKDQQLDIVTGGQLIQYGKAVCDNGETSSSLQGLRQFAAGSGSVQEERLAILEQGWRQEGNCPLLGLLFNMACAETSLLTDPVNADSSPMHLLEEAFAGQGPDVSAVCHVAH
ncbi:MAG: hypothetical protein ABSG21_11425 [Spirochaetia bacterium]